MFNIQMALIILFAALLPACTGKTGPAGPNGSNGTSASNTYQAILQNSVFPTSSYSGELDTWLSGGDYQSGENASPYLELNTSNAINNCSRILIRFDVSSIPVNASVVSSELLLTSETATVVGTNPVKVGLHNLASDTFAGCRWRSDAAWMAWTQSNEWNACTGDSSLQQEGYINPTTISTVVFTSANNSQSQVFKWSIDPTIVQAWVAGTYNNGLILKSEGEFGEPTSAVDFYPYTDTTGKAAQLIVEYQ